MEQQPKNTNVKPKKSKSKSKSKSMIKKDSRKQSRNFIVENTSADTNESEAGWSNAKLAIIGYTLGGSCVGYLLREISFSVSPKWIIFGGLTGLSVGLVKTYKKPIVETTTMHGGTGTVIKTHKSDNTSIGSAIKFVGSGFLIYYLAVPILLLGGGVLFASKVRERRYY